MTDLKPGEARPVKLSAFRCRCTRCDHEWIALARPLDGHAEIPERCGSCRSPYWRDARGALPMGRPPKK